MKATSNCGMKGQTLVPLVVGFRVESVSFGLDGTDIVGPC